VSTSDSIPTPNTEAEDVITDRITTLKLKHTNLDEAIRIEGARPMPDFYIIAELKKKKLTLKQEISELEKRKSDAA
jgi:hypothetical protein